jgi:predicted PurR-regulated permease PerM
MTMTYTRLLITEKCKCSEDIRRELIYAGSTIEILLLAMFVLIAIVFPLLLSSLSILFKNMKSVSSTIEENLKNPIKGITKLPSQVAEVGKQVKEVVSTTAKGVKSLTKK